MITQDTIRVLQQRAELYNPENQTDLYGGPLHVDKYTLLELIRIWHEHQETQDELDTRLQERFDDGYEEGYRIGHAAGYEAGSEDAYYDTLDGDL